MMPNTVALEEYLKPFEKYMQDGAISNILINRPGYIFIERTNGLFEQEKEAAYSMRHLMGLANLIARYSDQRLSEKEPLLSGDLPSGHRIQIILPPATEQHRIVLSIRKQTIKNVSLDDYAGLNAFSNTKICYLPSYRQQAPINENDGELIKLFKAKQFIEFLKLAVINKKNIIIAGATNTGKTTFLNACLKMIPAQEHIVTLEDVRELYPTHAIHTPLLASKGQQGVADVTFQDLIQACLRIRPDRIIMGELRGSEAADFINAAATGHDGTLSSIHASSPYMTFMRLVHMVKLSGLNLSREDILDDLHAVVDIVVQLKCRVTDNRFFREVSEIYYVDGRQS
jgi:type IV secretion system protein VirB11